MESESPQITQKTQNSPLSQTPETKQKRKQRKSQEFVSRKIVELESQISKTKQLSGKYFSSMRDKINKYMEREQRRIITQYESTLDMTIQFLKQKQHRTKQEMKVLPFSNLSGANKNKEQHRESSETVNSSQSVLNNISQSHEMALKLYFSKLNEQTAIIQNDLNQKLKLVGDGLKTAIKSYFEPIYKLFDKIPSFCLWNDQKMFQSLSKQGVVLQNSRKGSLKDVNGSQESLVKLQKNSRKISDTLPLNKAEKKILQKNSNQIINSSQRNKQKRNSISNKLRDPSYNSFVGKLSLQKLQNTQSMEGSIANIQERKFWADSKKTVNLALVDELVKKMPFTVYSCKQTKKISQDNAEQAIELHGERNQQILRSISYIEIELNNKLIPRIDISFKNHQLVCTTFCRLSFESKPNREYILAILEQPHDEETGLQLQQDVENMAQINNRVHQNQKIFMDLYNYKCEQIVQQEITKHFQRISAADDKTIGCHQLGDFKETFFVIRNYQIVRCSLQNANSSDRRLYSLDQKLIYSNQTSDSLVVYEGRNSNFEILSHQLELLHLIKRDSMLNFGPEIFRSFVTGKIIGSRRKMDIDKCLIISVTERQDSPQSRLNPEQSYVREFLLAPMTHLDSSELRYIEFGFLRWMPLRTISHQPHSRSFKNRSLGYVECIIPLDGGLFLIICKEAINSTKLREAYLLKVQQRQMIGDEAQEKQLQGLIWHLDSIKGSVTSGKYIESSGAIWLTFKNSESISKYFLE